MKKTELASIMALAFASGISTDLVDKSSKIKNPNSSRIPLTDDQLEYLRTLDKKERKAELKRLRSEIGQAKGIPDQEVESE